MSPNPRPDFKRALEAALKLAGPSGFADARRKALTALGPEGEAHGGERGEAAAALVTIAERAEAAGDLSEAEKSLRAAVRLAPRFPDLRYRLARLLDRAERLDEACEELRAALAVNPDYLAARVDLALLRARLGHMGDALEELRRLAQNREPGEAEAFRAGLEALGEAEWADAEVRLHRAYGLGSGSVDGAIADYTRLMAEGRHPQARALVRDLLRTHEGYPDLHCMLGRAELLQGHADDAVASFTRALELNPAFHAARVELALAFEALGQVSHARDQIQAVLQADPRHPGALRWLARWERRRPADIGLDPERGRGQSS